VSTEEQAKGSKQISSSVENITERIQQIASAINEQKRGNEVITRSILDIHQITQLSLQMVQEMNQAADELISQATQLKSEVNHFKI
jgi:methyl-accepting chemotaxis protein